MSNALKPIEQGAGLPRGFLAAGVAAGIKSNGARDLALLVSDRPASTAAVFTTNAVCAAPVKLGRERLAAGRPARAVVVNSGNANACTGAQGLRDALRTAACAAEVLGLSEQEVYVCSTGHIGDLLPMDRLEAGLVEAAAQLDPLGGAAAAEAIMTTDTRPKSARVTMDFDGREIVLTGLVKGSGMIEPNMATMLCFLLTDAAVEPVALQQVLAEAVDLSFNRISVDGDQSTNDTVIALANGAAEGDCLDETHPAWPLFSDAVKSLCLDLALQIVRDGEGAHKLVTIKVEGARDEAEADQAARAIARSFLVKTSWAGNTANWGRILATLGRSGVAFKEPALSLDYNEVPAVRGGVYAGAAEEELNRQVSLPVFTLRVDLGLGMGRAVLYTCECTEEYVRINVV